jgi:hypothetical protein
MKKGAVLLVLSALVLASAWIWLSHRPSDIEQEVLSAARAGSFPQTKRSYDGQVDCRVSEPKALQGQDIFLCKLGLKGVPFELGGQYVYVALINGELHTHATDSEAIPGRVFDPPF